MKCICSGRFAAVKTLTELADLLLSGEPERARQTADAGLLQRLDRAQERSRQGEGPGTLQTNAAAPVPARESGAVL